jgi:diaminopimelate epimerase
MLFTKMHGLGNDFIVIEDFDDKYQDYPSIAVNMCDRHFGIGADGILVVKRSDIADSRMLIFNSDGSQAEMCGNGIRCFAKYLSDKGLTARNNINVETIAGVRNIEVLKTNGIVSGVKVNMGKPDFRPESVPIKIEKDRTVNELIEIEGKNYYITSMLLGVPHTVLFVDEPDITVVEKLGGLIENSRYFPRKTNVNFVKVIDRNEFIVRTWERGAGLTLACGTGTCASLAACVVNKKTEMKATAHLLGGDMQVEWDVDGNVYMTGPAVTVFRGEYVI